MNIMYLTNSSGIIETLMRGDDALEDINQLLKQLYLNAPKISQRRLGDIMHHGNFFWAIDKDCIRVVGIATLTRAYKPTAFFGTMEDVVVDKKYRGNGIGTELINRLREKAKEQGMAYVDFTSNPARIATNERCIKMGAEKRSTNVYRFNL